MASLIGLDDNVPADDPRSVGAPSDGFFLPPVVEGIPAELRTIPRWVTWAARGPAGQKAKKIPYDPKLIDSAASSTNPDDWGTFDQAVAAWEEGDRTGIGIVLNGDGLVGVDIDGCVIDGIPSEEAITLLDQLGAQYIEVSPSGKGLRALGRASGLTSGVNGKLGGLSVELYSTGRYLTLTGRTLKAGPISDLAGFAELADFIRGGAGKSKVDQETGEITEVKPAERHAAWIETIRTGASGFHDAIRDLTASLVSTGMKPGAVVNHLYGLIDAAGTNCEDQERWAARRAEIPGLVKSAQEKFAPAGSTVPKRYHLLTAMEIACKPTMEWLIDGVIPEVGLAIIFGPSGSGKSFLALDMIGAIATGRPWFGLDTEKRKVVYVALEGESGLVQRVRAYLQVNGSDAFGDASFVTSPLSLMTDSDIVELAAEIRAAGGADGAVVFLDTLNRASPGADENTSSDMGTILSNTKKLEQLLGGLVVLVHHTGKDVSKGLRGHSSLIAAVDGAVEVVRDRVNGSRKWLTGKVKEGADDVEHGFGLHVVVVGQNKRGKDVTSCVVTQEAQVPSAKKLTGGNASAMKSLRIAMGKASIQTPSEVVNHTGRAKAPGWCVPEAIWRETAYDDGIAAEGTTDSAKRKAFDRARGALREKGYIDVACGYAWPIDYGDTPP